MLGDQQLTYNHQTNSLILITTSWYNLGISRIIEPHNPLQSLIYLIILEKVFAQSWLWIFIFLKLVIDWDWRSCVDVELVPKDKTVNLMINVSIPGVLNKTYHGVTECNVNGVAYFVLFR